MGHRLTALRQRQVARSRILPVSVEGCAPNSKPSSVRTNGKRAIVNRFVEARGYAIDNRRCSLLDTSAAQSQARASRRLSCRLASP
jgi:hypothetical protein